jgi:hypothetical protein
MGQFMNFLRSLSKVGVGTGFFFFLSYFGYFPGNIFLVGRDGKRGGASKLWTTWRCVSGGSGQLRALPGGGEEAQPALNPRLHQLSLAPADPAAHSPRNCKLGHILLFSGRWDGKRALSVLVSWAQSSKLLVL